jgi:MFS superfamily sulfate permease-like transporter
VALDCSAVIDIEYTAIKMLVEAEMKMSDQGIALWLVALNPNTLDVVRRSQLGETLGRERIVSNLETAVQQFQQPQSPDRRPA